MPSTPTLPPASIWEQFEVVAVIVLVVSLMMIALYRFWKEFQHFQEKENEKRSAERERQRQWQTEQNEYREAEQTKRDEAWRELIKMLQVNQSEDAQKTNTLLAKLVERMDAVTSELSKHDTWARATIEHVKQDLKK